MIKYGQIGSPPSSAAKRTGITAARRIGHLAHFLRESNGCKRLLQKRGSLLDALLEDAPQDAALDHLLPVERKVDAGGPVQNGQDGAEPLFVAGRRSLLFRA